MSISTVIERAEGICIYNEQGLQTGIIQIGNRQDFALMGHTPTNVNIRRGRLMYIYDDKGIQIRVLPI